MHERVRKCLSKQRDVIKEVPEKKTIKTYCTADLDDYSLVFFPEENSASAVLSSGLHFPQLPTSDDDTQVSRSSSDKSLNLEEGRDSSSETGNTSQDSENSAERTEKNVSDTDAGVDEPDSVIPSNIPMEPSCAKGKLPMGGASSSRSTEESHPDSLVMKANY
jgi:hypothetical protein